MLEGKKILVCGGSGSIGGAVVDLLVDAGAKVYATAGSEEGADRFIAHHPDADVFHLDAVHPDERKRDSLVAWVELTLHSKGPIDGIVYSVGRCPPGGFDEAIRYPFNALPAEQLRQELDLHVVGLLNVFKTVLSALKNGAAIVVVSSAITRATLAPMPDWLYAGHYAAAKAAQDELTRWMRRDSVVRQRCINIHRLAFGAVDTPFHHGCRHSPPALIPLKAAASEIVAALDSETIVDKVILPSPTNPPTAA